MNGDAMGVIFDLDGTLIESAPAIQGVGNRLLIEHGLEPLSLAETRSFIGAGAGKFVERALTARNAFEPDALPAVLDRFQALYAEADPAENAPMPGAVAALETLREAGCALALCTNKPAAPTRSVIEALGWTSFFEVVVDGETLPVKKPDPAPLLEAGRRLGRPVFLYVGDSDVDAETAERAGAPFFLYTEGYRRARVEDLPKRAAFSDFGELIALIEREAAVR